MSGPTKPSKPDSKPSADPKPASVFPAFPEPQGWSAAWDGTALTSSRPQSPSPSPSGKPQR